jgi:GNAT superfamily N-acetyltransferase
MALICPLPAVDRHRLLPLLEAYAAAMRGVLAGAAIAAPAAQAALLATHPAAKVLLAEEAGEPAGFAVLFDLPEIVFARRCGQLDDLFVLPAWRGRGIARAGRGGLRARARAAGAICAGSCRRRMPAPSRSISASPRARIGAATSSGWMRRRRSSRRLPADRPPVPG